MAVWGGACEQIEVLIPVHGLSLRFNKQTDFWKHFIMGCIVHNNHVYDTTVVGSVELGSGSVKC